DPVHERDVRKARRQRILQVRVAIALSEQADTVVPLPDPVANYRRVPANAIGKADVGEYVAIADLVRQVEVAIRRSIDAGAVETFACPTTRHPYVARDAQDHHVIGKAGRQIVLQVDQAVRWPEHTDAEMASRAAPSAAERDVVGVAEDEFDPVGR